MANGKTPLTEEWLLSKRFKQTNEGYKLKVAIPFVGTEAYFVADSINEKYHLNYKVNGYWASYNMHYVEEVEELYRALTKNEL